MYLGCIFDYRLKKTSMTTMQTIKDHASAIREKGAPFTKDELFVLKLATPSGKSGNAGKRTKKNHNKNW